MDDPRQNTAPLRWLSSAILGLAALYLALLSLYLARWHVLPGYRVIALVCACLACALGLALRLPRQSRANLALAVAASGAALFLVEALLTAQGATWSKRRDDATVAFARAAGRPVGSLDPWDVVRALRGEGVRAVPFFASYMREQVARSDGLALRILAGVSGAVTVACNESGRFVPYLADEHGFNNPPGLHGLESLDVALVGDSFTHSACVPREDSVAGRIRERHPRTLNLGIRGTGPLAALAALAEYASPARPRVVVWGWFEGNDPMDLERELHSPELGRYLAEPRPFGLRELQAEIDQTWRRRERWEELKGLAAQSRIVDILLLRATLARFQPAFMVSGATLPDAERVLTAARDAARSWGGELLLVYLPDALRYCAEVSAWSGWCDARRAKNHAALGLRTEMLALFDRLGTPVVDGHAEFLAAGRPGEMFYHPMSHYSPAGYRVIADAVLRELGPMLE